VEGRLVAGALAALAACSFDIRSAGDATIADTSTGELDAAIDAAVDAAVDAAIDAPTCVCVDTDPCTVDACVGSVCQHSPLTLPSGCTGMLMGCTGEPTCYARCTDSRSWAAAESVCVTWGGHLVTLLSDPESACIGTALGTGGRAWIGLVQQAGDPEPAGGWEWASGLTSSYVNWIQGQPNNATDILPAGQDCAFAEGTTGEWYDHECTSGGTFPYFCER
jgi:hypothetical protein